jgi:transcription antitermination factor NusG
MDGITTITATTEITSMAPTIALPAAATGERECFWYAACTRSRHEKSIVRQLEERGIEYFLPLYRSVRRWKDRRKELDLVLFPGYVFVRLPWRERLRVLQLPSILRFVTFNGLPAALPISELEALRNGLTQGVYAASHPYLRVGKRVLVRYGPLAGASGILVRKKDNFRIVISIEAIMRSVAVEIDEGDVVPLS